MSGDSYRGEKKDFTRKRMQMIQKRTEEPRKVNIDTAMEREMTREEKDEKGRKCMEIMQKKNEELKRRYAEVQQDRKSAEETQSSITLQYNVSASSSKEEEIVKPHVHTREWDKHKTCDSAWEPPEDWKSSFERRSNFPDRRYDRSKDYADKRGSYSRQDRRYQNNFNSAETKSKFVKDFDNTPRRNNFAFRQTNNNQNYIPRGRGRGLKPRMYEKVSHGDDNVRSSSFNHASSDSSQRSHIHQNTTSTIFNKKPYSGWSNSSVENDNRTPSSFHKEQLKSTFSDRRKFETGVSNKSQMFKKRLTPPGSTRVSSAPENKVKSGNWSESSEDDKVRPNFHNNSTSREQGEMGTCSNKTEVKKQHCPTENPNATVKKSKNSWSGSSSEDDYKPRTDMLMKSAETSKKSEIRSNNRSQILEKRSLSVTVCDTNRRVVQSSENNTFKKSLNVKAETAKIRSGIESKRDEWPSDQKLKDDNCKMDETGAWSDTEDTPGNQQLDGWSDEATSNKLKICDSKCVDTPFDGPVDINKKCSEYLINIQKFRGTELNVENASSNVLEQDHKNCSSAESDTKEINNDGVTIKKNNDICEPNTNSKGSHELIENISDIVIESSNTCSDCQSSARQLDAESTPVYISDHDASLNPKCDETGFDVQNTSTNNPKQREGTCPNADNFIKCSTTICDVKEEAYISRNNDKILYSKSVSNESKDVAISSIQSNDKKLFVHISEHDAPVNENGGQKYDVIKIDDDSLPKHKDDASNVENHQKCDSTKSDGKDTPDISQNNDVINVNQNITSEPDKNSECPDFLAEAKSTKETFAENENSSGKIIENNEVVYDNQDITLEPEKYSKCSDSLDKAKNINETLVENEIISGNIIQNNDVVYDNKDITPEPEKNSKCSDSLDEVTSISETLVENENISGKMMKSCISDSNPPIPTVQLNEIGDIIVCDVNSSVCLPGSSVDSKRAINATAAERDSKCDDANDDSWDTYSEGTGSED